MVVSATVIAVSVVVVLGSVVDVVVSKVVGKSRRVKIFVVVLRRVGEVLLAGDARRVVGAGISSLERPKISNVS